MIYNILFLIENAVYHHIISKYICHKKVKISKNKWIYTLNISMDCCIQIGIIESIAKCINSQLKNYLTMFL